MNSALIERYAQALKNSVSSNPNRNTSTIPSVNSRIPGEINAKHSVVMMK